MVCEFYKAYGKTIAKSKNIVKVVIKPLDAMEVQGVQVICSELEINDIGGCTYRYKNDMDEMMKVQTFDDIKAWLAPMIGLLAPSWFEEGAIIKKKEMNISNEVFGSNLLAAT